MKRRGYEDMNIDDDDFVKGRRYEDMKIDDDDDKKA